MKLVKEQLCVELISMAVTTSYLTWNRENKLSLETTSLYEPVMVIIYWTWKYVFKLRPGLYSYSVRKYHKLTITSPPSFTIQITQD